MNIILLEPDELKKDHNRRIVLEDQRAHHILEVIRPAPGDQLRVGLLGGQMGLAKVLYCGDRRIELEIILDTEPPMPLPVTLLLALPRPKVLRRVLQSCTTLGIKQIYLINSYRVEKSYWQSPLLTEEAIRAELLGGLEQARDTVLPEVHLRKRFKPFVEDELPSLANNKLCLTAHPDASADRCPTCVDRPTLLAIGPEGGFIAYEVDKFTDNGFQTISLGPRILKVETAISALTARLFY